MMLVSGRIEYSVGRSDVFANKCCFHLVRSMYPPLDARLLEARLSALVLAVGQLALLAQSISEKRYLDWIDECMIEMDQHLLVSRAMRNGVDVGLISKFVFYFKVLRKAAMDIEEQNRNNTHIHSSQV